MLMRTKKWLVSLMTFVCVAILAIAVGISLPASKPVKAAAETTNLSDFGGALADAKYGYIEGTEETAYVGEYDFAAHDNKLDLAFDLKLTKKGGQTHIWLKSDKNLNDGLVVILFTGATGGSHMGAALHYYKSKSGSPIIGNTGVVLSEDDLTGQEFTVNLSVEFTKADCSEFTISLNLVNKDSTKFIKTLPVWDNQKCTAPADFVERCGANTGASIFVAGGATVGVKDVVTEESPETPAATTNLSDFGGALADAATQWIETTEETAYVGEYDFAAHDNKLDLTFDLKLTKVYNQIQLWIKTDEAVKKGLQVVIFTGTGGAARIGGTISGTDIGSKVVAANDMLGQVFTVHFTLEWSNNYNTIKSSLSFTSDEAGKTITSFEAWKDYEYTFTNGLGEQCAELDNFAVFSAGGTNVGLSDYGKGADAPSTPNTPDPPDTPVETPTAVGSLVKPEDKTENVIAIEDIFANTLSYTTTNGATVTSDGNLSLAYNINDDRHPNFSLKSRDNGGKFGGEYAVKFRTVSNLSDPATAATKMDGPSGKNQKVATTFEMFLELNATSQGSYSSASGSNMIYFVWSKALNAAASGGTYVAQFFYNGREGSSQVIQLDLTKAAGFDATMFDNGKEVFIEFGQFARTINGVDYYVMYVEASNAAGQSIYAECQFGGSYIMDHVTDGGYIRMSAPSYIRTAPVDILAVDSALSATEKFVPEYQEAANVKDHDISDYLPIGQNGITYTTTSADDTKNIINVKKFINNTKNDMYMSFKGDYNLKLAFFTDRYEEKNCSAGYQIIFTPTGITLQSFSGGAASESKYVEYAMPENTKVKVTIRLVQLYTDGMASGERVTLYINDVKVAEVNFGLQSSGLLPTYFDGIMSGNGSVSIYPFSSTVAADSNLTFEVDPVAVGKQKKLEVENGKSIIGETVSFRISEGADYAEIVESDGRYYLKGKADGVVKVVAVVTNEYGTFEKEIEVTVGAGVTSSDTQTSDSNAGQSCAGCSGSITDMVAPMMLLAAFAVVTVIIRKRRNDD